MASVRELARKTGFSPATVSRALKSHPDVSEMTRDKVLRAAELTGYLDRSDDSTFTSVGYVITGDPRLWEYDWMLLGGVLEGLRERRMDLQIVDLQHGKREDETYRQFFRRRGLRGVILRTYQHNRSICEGIVAEGFPSIVVGDRFDEQEQVSYVSCDSTDETEKGALHLLDLGHRRIALVMHRRTDRDHVDRYNGFMNACKARKMELDEDLILKVVPNLEGGRTAFNRLMSLPEPPTAILFTDPLPAIGALGRAHEAGLRIPRDLSIVGFDDGNARHRVYPTMTAVCQDTHELGLEAALCLCKRLDNGDGEHFQCVLHTRLEINQTTGVPPTQPIRLQPNGKAIE